MSTSGWNTWVPPGTYAYAVDVVGPAVTLYAIGEPVLVHPPPGACKPTPATPVTYPARAPKQPETPVDFIAPLLALGVEMLLAMRLYCRCGEDTALATAVAAMAIHCKLDITKVLDSPQALEDIKGACLQLQTLLVVNSPELADIIPDPPEDGPGGTYEIDLDG